MSRRLNGNPGEGYTPIKPSTKPDGFVYIHHFHEPIGSEKHQAQHYIGRAKDVDARVAAERKGGPDAPRIMQVLKERGIGFDVVQVWPGNSYVENALKSYGTAKPLCPKCTDKPRVPQVVQKVIRRQARSRAYYRRKEAAQQKMRELMSRPPDAAEKQRLGSEAASRFVQGYLSKGMSVAQIEELADNISYGDGRQDSHARIGWDRQVNADLALARELERQDELARARAEEAASVETYKQNLTALADRESSVDMSPDYSWLPTPEELARHPARSQEMEATA